MRTILLALIFVIPANAGFVSDMVDGYGIGPEYYASQERGYVTFGSYSERIPNVTVNPISITPPSITAGCNGIDVVTGGLSFMKKDALVNLYKQLTNPNTLKYTAISIGMKMLGSEIADNIESAMDIMQKINSLQLDGCAIAEGAVTFVSDVKNSGYKNAIGERASRAMNMVRDGYSDSADDAMDAAASPEAAARDKAKVLKNYSAKEYLENGGYLLEYIYKIWRANGGSMSSGSEFSFPGSVDVTRVRALYGDVKYDPEEESYTIIPPCKSIGNLADISKAFYAHDGNESGECRVISEESVNDYVNKGMDSLYNAYTGLESTIDQNFVNALQGTSVLTLVKQDAGAKDKAYLKSSIIYLADLAKTELAYKYVDIYQQHMGEILQRFADDAAANAGVYGNDLSSNTNELIRRAKANYYKFHTEYANKASTSYDFIIKKRTIEQASQRGANKLVTLRRW